MHEKIQDESYFQNFVGLARQIAPDGQAVRTVGFTAGGRERERRVAFSKPRPQLRQESIGKMQTTPALPPVRLVQVRGTLLEADATSQRTGTIEVVDDDNKKHRIRVPRGMMRDIVKPMFEEHVLAQVQQDAHGVYDLVSIDLDDESGAA